MLNPDMRPFGGTGSLDRFIRYCVVGSVNTAIDVLIFLLLTTDVKMAAVPANIVSYTAALCVSFVLNRIFTFYSSAFSLILAVQFFRFLVINLISLFGSSAMIWLLVAIMAPIAAKIATIPLVTAWGFVAVRLLAFRPKT